jgi:DNA-binding NtrC family response regulator
MGAAPCTVLIVDDDAVLRSSLESVLESLGYRVLSTGSPDAAYQLLATESAIAVLLDVRLPTMSGLSLYLAMTHRWPQLQGRVALMTADADAPDVRTWTERNPCTVIRKPFTFREITGCWTLWDTRSTTPPRRGSPYRTRAIATDTVAPAMDKSA